MEPEIKNEIPVEVQEKMDKNDIINNENIDDFKLLNMAAQIRDFKKLAAEIKEKKEKTSIEGDEYLDDIIDKMTLEEIKSMDYAKAIEICKPPEGVEDIFGGAFDSKLKEGQFKKDYLIFRKETNIALAGIDEETAKFEAEMAEYEEDMKRLSSDYGDVTGYVRKTLTDRLETAETEEQKENIRTMITMMDYAMSLENVIEFYSNSYRARVAIPNVIGPRKTTTIKNYEKVLADISCRTDFRKFGGIEKRFLPDEYKDVHENAFICAIINYVASWYKNEDNKMNGVFLAQFSINLKNLIYDRFATDKDKEEFIASVCKVIDLVK